jgi:hypothetical protein
MPVTMPVATDLVKAVTKFVDALHQHYNGITVQPISRYEDEDVTFEITIPKHLRYEQVLETCQRECISIEDEFDLFIFPHIVYENE